eukprot:1161076-Pelagomonas_calceolata.AAC.11
MGDVSRRGASTILAPFQTSEGIWIQASAVRSNKVVGYADELEEWDSSTSCTVGAAAHLSMSQHGRSRLQCLQQWLDAKKRGGCGLGGNVCYAKSAWQDHGTLWFS